MSTVRFYTGPTETDLRPNPDQILRQLDFWFGDQTKGEIDVGTYDGTDKLNVFQRFGLHELETLAEYACDMNRRPGRSMYFRPALVEENAPVFVKDKHFLRAPGIWCDLDKEGQAERASIVASTTRPNMVIVTGRHPYVRAQMFWRADEAITDPDTLRRLNSRASDLFGGDSLVINPTSLMRLAGTIAWPRKQGRVLELTDLKLFSDDRPKQYPVAAIERAFPPTERAETRARHDADPFHSFGGLVFSRSKLIAAIRRGENWHKNVLSLVARYVNSGLADEEILTLSEALTLPGYTVDQTRREVEIMIRGAREKWGIEEPSDEEQTVPDPEGTPPLEATPLGILTPTAIQPRQWILGNRLIRKFVTLTVAPGGSGKSLLTMEEMIAIATGIPITGAEVRVPGPAWIYNNEDPLDELHRRIAAICLHHEIDLTGPVASRLFLNSGRDRRLVVAKDLNNAIIQTPDAEELEAAIRKNGIVAMTIDPFVRVHQVDENDNAAIDAVADIFARIADKTGCAFNLVHHTRKAPAGSSEGLEGIADNSRGAGSLVAAARIAHTVLPMSTKDAERLGIPAEDRRWYVRMDDAKGNMSPPAEGAEWFKWESVPLGNGSLGIAGDEVGVLGPWEAPELSAPIPVPLATAMLTAINERWIQGNPLAKKGDRSITRFLSTNFELREFQAKKLVSDWLNNGMLVSEIYDRKTKTAGLRVAKWPGQAAE